MSPAARVAVFISVVLGIWTLEHLYVGWRLLGLPALSGQTAHRAALALLVAGFLAYPLAQFLGRAGHLPVGALAWAGAVWMGVVFLLLAFFLAVDVVTVGGLVLKSAVPALRSGAALLALLASLAAVVGGHVRPRVVELEVVLPGLPAASDGLTLVQVSDLHLGGSVGQGRLHRVVDRVLALRPDLVVVTGDLVDGSVPAVEPMLPELERLRAPLGVLAVLGNHEFYAGASASRGLLRAAGYTVLDNAAVEVAPGLFVAGVPDARGARQTGQPPFADLAAALGQVPAESAVVLLQHSPEEEAEAAAAGAGLMLSGHTHGGQIWPFHYAVRAAYRHIAGVYRVGAMTHVVSRGAGLWGPPMRLFAPADVVRITLRSALTGRAAPPA
jgi:uncharacterized protein